MSKDPDDTKAVQRMTKNRGVYFGGRIFGPPLNWVVRTSGLSRLILWFCFDYKGKVPKWVIAIAPWLFGLAVGRKPHRVHESNRIVEGLHDE